MPVTERLMQAGQWSLSLDPSTPKSVRDVLKPFGHIFVFNGSVRAPLADADMIALARWGGLLRDKPNPWSLRGANMIVWLGDEDDVGALYTALLGPTNTTFTGWMTALINNASGAIHTGSVVAGGTNKNLTYQYVSPRKAIENICSLWGYEFRVNKDWTVDGGSPTFLGYKITPTAAALKRSSGRDMSLVGIPVTQLDVASDSQLYVTHALVHDATGAYTDVAGAATTYRDGYGNLIVMRRLYEQSLTATAQAAAQGAVLVARDQALRTVITLGSDEFDIDRDVKVGDYVWVQHEDADLVDTTNPVRYRGSWIFPLALRVFSSTWPIEQGMGVWYRSGATAGNSVWTDITRFVSFESPGVSFEVGAPVRKLTS